MRKPFVILIVLLLFAGSASSALADGTPYWWVAGNPDKSPPDGFTTTTWHYGWSSGTVGNLDGDQMIYVTVRIDVPNNYSDTMKKYVWAQAEWTATGVNADDSFPMTPLIRYSNTGCPANAGLALPTPRFGPYDMDEEGTTTPDAAHVNPTTSEAYQSANEYSFGYPDGISPQPACERIEFTFQVGVDTTVDWRVEVQTACMNTTAVNVKSFTATSAGTSVALNWETSNETDNVGFNVYREASADGELVKLNKTMIPTNVPPGSITGAKYSFDDASGLAAGAKYTYWLEDVSTSGATSRHGPANVTYAGAPTAIHLAQFGAAPAGAPALMGLIALATGAGTAIRKRRQTIGH